MSVISIKMERHVIILVNKGEKKVGIKLFTLSPANSIRCEFSSYCGVLKNTSETRQLRHLVRDANGRVYFQEDYQTISGNLRLKCIAAFNAHAI